METSFNVSEIYLECLPDPMLVIDADGFTQYANHAFAELTGITKEDLIGRSIDALKIQDKYKNLFWENCHIMKPGDICRQQFMQKRKDGGFAHYDIRLVAVECPVESNKVISFIAITNEITDILDKTRQMLFVESELQKSADTLKQLLYKSSHDLRAPIATIQGLVALAKLDLSTPDMPNYLEMIMMSSKKMDAILSDLRRVYTMYLGNFQAEEIDFYALVNTLLKNHQEDEVNVKVSINLMRRHFHCKYLLEKIFINLLDNAFKYRLPGSKVKHCVEIKIEDTDDSLHILIRDNGRGIKKEIQGLIFEMFFKGNSDSKKNGMGLFLVKTAVNKLYGKIHVESKIGRGTTMTVILP